MADLLAKRGFETPAAVQPLNLGTLRKGAILMTKPIITPDELRTLLNRRRYEGERIEDKRAIRRAAEEIERLRAALQAVAERASEALEK